MRAEAQAHIDQINAATALLRRFIDWDRALKRLEELNAKVEDAALWADPKAAQNLMRERRRLEEAIGATRTLERELADTAELIELAESEGDNALVDDARRHTSFSSVWVYPEVDDDIDIQINDAELRIDTYRASGAGGQHVNTTDSAVRITHVPTGIVVACQNERSQHKNRASAMKQLKARLYEAELQKREAQADAANAAKTDIGWGHQIRSYVLQPYQLVKDLRTGVTSTSPGDVLDGDLDRFMAAALSQRGTGETVEVEDVD